MNRAKLLTGFTMLACLLLANVAATHATVLPDNMGDIINDQVFESWDGESNSLNNKLASLPTPILDPLGGLVVTGEGYNGESLIDNAQTQYQRFLAETDTIVKMTFLGGVAGYDNIFGVYTYDPSNPADMVMQDIFRKNGTSHGEMDTYLVEAGQMFGFFLNANGGRNSKGTYYSENHRNPDSNDQHTTDHALMLSTNQGMVVAFEDLGLNHKTGLMGDQDFNDTFVAVEFQDAPHMPEPASLVIAVGGLALMARRRRRDA